MSKTKKDWISNWLISNEIINSDNNNSINNNNNNNNNNNKQQATSSTTTTNTTPSSDTTLMNSKNSPPTTTTTETENTNSELSTVTSPKSPKLLENIVKNALKRGNNSIYNTEAPDSKEQLEFVKPSKLRKLSKVNEKELVSSPVSGTFIIKDWNDDSKNTKKQASTKTKFSKDEVLLNSVASNYVQITPEAIIKLKKIRNIIGDYECKLCKYVYKDAFELAMHNCPRVVHVEYKCTECNKSFNCPANLASHKRWHRPKRDEEGLIEKEKETNQQQLNDEVKNGDDTNNVVTNNVMNKSTNNNNNTSITNNCETNKDNDNNNNTSNINKPASTTSTNREHNLFENLPQIIENNYNRKCQSQADTNESTNMTSIWQNMAFNSQNETNLLNSIRYSNLITPDQHPSNNNTQTIQANLFTLSNMYKNYFMAAAAAAVVAQQQQQQQQQQQTLMKQQFGTSSLTLPSFSANVQPTTSTNSTTTTTHIDQTLFYQRFQPLSVTNQHHSHENTNYTCKYCYLSFSDNYTLIYHIRKAHSSILLNFQ